MEFTNTDELLFGYIILLCPVVSLTSNDVALVLGWGNELVQKENYCPGVCCAMLWNHLGKTSGIAAYCSDCTKPTSTETEMGVATRRRL